MHYYQFHVLKCKTFIASKFRIYNLWSCFLEFIKIAEKKTINAHQSARRSLTFYIVSSTCSISSILRDMKSHVRASMSHIIYSWHNVYHIIWSFFWFYYPTVYIRSNCLFFAISWVTPLLTSQYFDYCLALYHDLVSCFAFKTHMRLSTCATTMRVQFVYKRRLTTLNSNNFVVYGQKYKVSVLVFFERAEHFETKLSRFGEIFCFATKPHRLQQLQSRNSA